MEESEEDGARTGVDALVLDLALPREVLVALLDLVGEKKRQVWPDLRRRTRRNKRRRTSGEALFHISLMSCCTAWSTSQRRGRSASGFSDGVERLEARREREEEERGSTHLAQLALALAQARVVLLHLAQLGGAEQEPGVHRPRRAVRPGASRRGRSRGGRRDDGGEVSARSCERGRIERDEGASRRTGICCTGRASASAHGLDAQRRAGGRSERGRGTHPRPEREAKGRPRLGSIHLPRTSCEVVLLLDCVLARSAGEQRRRGCKAESGNREQAKGRPAGGSGARHGRAPFGSPRADERGNERAGVRQGPSRGGLRARLTREERQRPCERSCGGTHTPGRVPGCPRPTHRASASRTIAGRGRRRAAWSERAIGSFAARKP